MKRILITAAVCMMSLLFTDKASAGNFGVLAGSNFSTTNIKQLNAETALGPIVGVTYKFDLPFGLQIQPALMYNMKNTKVGTNFLNTSMNIGYLELMASLQWGLDLIAFRPFLDLSPYVGYGLHGKFGNMKDVFNEGGMKQLETGVALGAGLDVWKFQVIARYNWNLTGVWDSIDEIDDAADYLSDKLDGFGSLYNTVKGAKFGGFSVTLAYFF